MGMIASPEFNHLRDMVRVRYPAETLAQQQEIDGLIGFMGLERPDFGRAMQEDRFRRDWLGGLQSEAATTNDVMGEFYIPLTRLSLDRTLIGKPGLDHHLSAVGDGVIDYEWMVRHSPEMLNGRQAYDQAIRDELIQQHGYPADFQIALLSGDDHQTTLHSTVQALSGARDGRRPIFTDYVDDLLTARLKGADPLDFTSTPHLTGFAQPSQRWEDSDLSGWDSSPSQFY